MTNNTNINENNKNEKIFILEWESAELKDRTMRYEKFKVVWGSEKENLFFYSTFFIDNFKFKKGEFYQLSTPGNFVEDASGTIPGGYDASGIIQGIDNGGYEFEKIVPALLIKELWEEKEENIRKLNISEEDLEQKRKNVTKINQELLAEKRERSDLRNKFSNLQLEKTKIESEKEKVINDLNSLKIELQKEKENVKEKEEKLVNSRNEVTQLQNQFNSLQAEKNKIENEYFSPEKREQFLKDKENLSNKLKSSQIENRKLLCQIENIHNQGLKDNIQTKLEEKKKDQEQLKFAANDKLGNQVHLLENLLEKQEGFDLAVFEDADQKSRGFSRAQEKLQDAKDKLVSKLTPEEIEEFCQNQTEISKLEIQQKQWKEMEEKQVKEEQFAFVGTPPTSPR